MPGLIHSANPDFKALDGPSSEYNYAHGVEQRKSFIPLAFQITSPFDRRRALLPHALVMHVNPSNLNESFNKKIEKIQTRGGWVEQHWFDELTDMSADGSTGAFVNIYTGVTSVLRQRTIAWDRYRDLYDLFHNNGSVYDPYGNIVLQGSVMLLFDRGIYIGTFRSFDVDETDDSPFAFKLSWSFKVEETILKMPGYLSKRTGAVFPHPGFQERNALRGTPNSGAALSMGQANSEASVLEAIARMEANTRAEAVAALAKADANAEKEAPQVQNSPKVRPAPNNPNRSAGVGSGTKVSVPTSSSATVATPPAQAVQPPPQSRALVPLLGPDGQQIGWK